MTRNIMVVILLVMAFFVSPVFADGTLNITKGSLSTPYINTKTLTPMVNMTVNATVGQVNMTGMLVNLTGTASFGDVSGIFVYNDSDINGVIGSGDFLVGNSTVNTTTNTSNITFSSSFNIANGRQYYFIIALNISSGATRFTMVGINLTLNTSVYTAEADNITITGGYINSNVSQIQDVHATASISPRYVDTNVINQSLTYTINTTGNDKFNSTNITIPAGYTVVNVTYVGDSNGSLMALANIGFSAYLINVNYTSGYNGTLIINFTVNTNTSTVNSTAFISTISGSNLTSVATDVSGTYTNVTTQQLFNVTNVAVIKSAAYVNGTDYWEFNLTLNFTASVNGSLQFKMSNWTNSAGQSIALTSGLTNYATLRETSSNMINVSSDYNIVAGVSFTAAQWGTKNVILKMIIPTGTPVSSSWWTTYSALFRSTA